MKTQVDLLLEELAKLPTAAQQEFRCKFNHWLASPDQGAGEAVVYELRAEEESKDKPCCPHCQGDQIVGHGDYNGKKRLRCKDCGKTFSHITGTSAAYIRDKNKWAHYVRLMVQGLPLRELADKVGICLKTAFDWRHKILASFKELDYRKLEGITEVDETFFLFSEKGNKDVEYRPSHKRGGQVSKAGINDEHVAVLVSQDRNNHLLIEVGCRGRVSKKNIEEKLGKWWDTENGVLCSDAHRSYQAYTKATGMEHKILNQSKGQYVREEHYHLQHVNNSHQRIKQWMSGFNGVATKYLQHYMDYFRILDRIKFNYEKWKEFLRKSLASSQCYIPAKLIINTNL
jgi:transposase-like protein